MARQFDSLAWEDFQGDRHRGAPPDLSDTYGILVSVYDPDDPAYGRHTFWAWIPEAFEDWDEWYEYITALLAQHGYA